MTKKRILLLLSTMLLCACANEKFPNDECSFLTDANWEGKDSQCVNVISFKEDGTFSNWCYCGSPVGDGDLSETFRYRADDKTVLLLDSEEEIIETGKILYVDELYLIIDVWGRCYVYENLDANRPTLHTSALEYTGTEELSKPFLRILGYENGMLTVTNYDYEKDTASDFELWTLPAQENISFSNVSVTIENGKETVEVTKLTKDDYEHLGEFYTAGYVEMNQEGEVASIVFYGETIIY